MVGNFCFESFQFKPSRRMHFLLNAPKEKIPTKMFFFFLYEPFPLLIFLGDCFFFNPEFDIKKDFGLTQFSTQQHFVRLQLPGSRFEVKIKNFEKVA